MSAQRLDHAVLPENDEALGLRESVTVLVLGHRQPLLGTVTDLLHQNHYRACTCPRPPSLASLLLDREVDAVLIDLDDVFEAERDLHELLRDLPSDRTIPVVGLCSGESSQRYRLKAIGAGLWDVLEVPHKSAELLAKLETWIWMMQHMDEERSGVLIDVESGHYSFKGMIRRLREQAALAQRSGEPLSCVLFGSDPVPEGANASGIDIAGMEFSLALHDLTRDSDIVARIEPLKFAVLTPQTPPTGALKLAERVTSWSLSRRPAGHAPVTFSAGVAGVDSDHSGDENVLASPESLLTAARRAVNAARASGRAQVAVAWGQLC